MNIAFFLTPKQDVTSLFDDNTFRRGYELMMRDQYQIVPVTNRENIYVGVVSVADFLRYLCGEGIPDTGIVAQKNVDEVRIKDLMNRRNNGYPPVNITSDLDELIDRIMQHNFVPVVDARGAFVGIVTRHNVLRYLQNNNVR